MNPTLLRLGALAAVAAALPVKWSARERAVADAVRAEAIAAHVRFLADDLLEGRGAGSRGDELAMKYVAAQFERIGLKPAGDSDGYLQKFAIVGVTSETVAPPELRAAGKPGLALKPGEDSILASGRQVPAVRIADAEVVFVGYGIDAPEQKWDDFKNVDVRGKILLVMNNDPAGDPALFAGKTRLYYGRWTYKYEQAARKGAVGAIVIHTTPSAGYPWQVVQTSWSGENFELPVSDANAPALDVKMWITEERARQLVALGGRDLDTLRSAAERRDFRPVPLGVTLRAELRNRLRRVETANVLGLLPGADPRLTSELVVFSAHHDHLGIRKEKNGDPIYNGALDNASGVAAMLTIAEGMVKARPRRSVLFAALGVEESGLLGSEYLCAHPPVPVGRIAANLNIDGINIWGRTRDISFIGLGKSSLDQVVVKAAAEQGRVVKPDQLADRGHFYRSDQFNFARVGVPAVYFSEGQDFIDRPAGWGRERVEEYERQRYHQPSDQIDATWNLDGAVDDLRLLGVIGLRVADAPKMPAWTPGDEFEAARKRASRN